jgi:drug/metabolite transporter (DMT)-like permease
MRFRKEPVFPPNFNKMHAVMVGVLFGLEFAFIYLSQRYTFAGRAYIFLYTHPFWVALGAHYFLSGDRLSWKRFGGLLLAFMGLAFAFSEGLRHFSATVLKGDFYVLLGALGWAATTLYIKKYLIRSCNAFQTLFYQLLFSAPLLFGLSFFLEGTPFLSNDHRGLAELLGLVLSPSYLPRHHAGRFFLFHPHLRGLSQQLAAGGADQPFPADLPGLDLRGDLLGQ